MPEFTPEGAVPPENIQSRTESSTLTRRSLDALRGPKGTALALLTAAVATAAAFGIGKAVGESSQNVPPPSTPQVEGPAVPGSEGAATEFEKREKEVRGELQADAVSTAQSILTDLAKPDSGAQAYEDGRVFENKNQLTRNMPEIFVQVDPKTNKIIIAGVTVKVKGEGSNKIFDSAQLVFGTNGLDDSNHDGKFELPEISSALSAPGTTFEAADLQNGWGFNAKTNVETGEPYGVFVGQGGIVESRKGGDSFVGSALQGTVPEAGAGSDVKPLTTAAGLDAAANDFKRVTTKVTNSLSAASSGR